MELRAELLKSIWHAFTSLDVGESGKVSKSQLKVLSHNLCTALCITHDKQALELHFRDDDDGPVSSQGYMPYLNTYILDKAVEGTFKKEEVDRLCWTLCSTKNYHPEKHGSSALSKNDAFHLWCLFNFLSEDKYPLVLVPEEVEYLIKKICSAMSVELSCVDIEDFICQNDMQSGVNVWAFLDLMNSGVVTRGVDRESITMAIEEVYGEIVGNTLKEGYLWKKGHLRRNWTERWFSLKVSSLAYYTSEDRKDCKGVIEMDQNCCVEVLPDREGKRCMFCVKTLSKTYEMSAPDTKQRQEWTTAIQTAIRLCVEGKTSLHRELKLRRRDQREERERRRATKEEELRRLRLLQDEREQRLVELELLQEAQRQAQATLEQEEQKRRLQHEQLQRALQEQLQEAEEARANMQAEMAAKEAEAERQQRRIRELEAMQVQLEEALQLEIRARQDEEACRKTQARLLAEEEDKMKALLTLQEEQEDFILRTQREKQELRQEMENKSKALEEAQQQLEKVRASRHRVDQDIAAAQRKLRQASTSVKHWNIQMNRLMHPIGPGGVCVERRASIGGTPTTPTRLSSLRDSGLRLSLKCADKEDRKESQTGAYSNSRPVEESDASGDDTGIPMQTSNGSIESAN
ncbi:differentially expressed in FDCP 6 homolog isoform X1 [Alosa sapidissima]|uniref:differentially expressed in FDCP 6 homolog isoform X1 n=1 Tax=Alosa sapidissima TaxID=34773 RepID=UPI001C08EACE|nr:differentially expressed in FDCP 6 homolog isoform X1 [Alosa sapidissima]